MSSSTEKSDADTENEEENSSEQNVSKKKLLKEAMREIFVSVALVILTTLVTTQGDLNKSPASSLLASGNGEKCSIFWFFWIASYMFCVSVFHYISSQKNWSRQTFIRYFVTMISVEVLKNRYFATSTFLWIIHQLGFAKKLYKVYYRNSKMISFPHSVL